MEDNNKSSEDFERLIEILEEFEEDDNNGGNATNNSSVSNYRNINQGSSSAGNVARNKKPINSNSSIKPNGYRSGRTNVGNSKSINIPSKNNYRRPSNLMLPRNNSSSNVEDGESESKITEAKRKVDDITEKAVKVKKTIAFISKYKFIIIGICVAVVIIILFMFLIMVLNLDDDSSNGDSSGSYGVLTSNINGSNNGELWWPIGSNDVTTSIEVSGNVVEFRSGNPAYTTLTSDYGPRTNSFHYGVDIAASGDIYLIAMADGFITYISPNRDTGYNNVPDENLHCESHDGMIQINIKYNNGYESRYLHVMENSIPDYLGVGSKVYQGQVVGKMGNTGCSTGQHLHYELTLNGLRLNPNNFGISIDNPRLLSNNLNKSSEEILKELYEIMKQEQSNMGVVTIGKDNKQTICLTLKNYGYTDTGIAAIMVNMWHESGFKPNVINEIGCVGLVQWCFGRQVNVKTKYGPNWVLINNQLEHFYSELTSDYKYVYDNLQGNNSTSDKTYYFCMNFEVPGESLCVDRRNSNLNNEYYNYVKNGCN